MIKEEDIHRIFGYTQPNHKQEESIHRVRVAAAKMALAVMANVPKSETRNSAIRKIKMAMLIAIEGLLGKGC